MPASLPGLRRCINLLMHVLTNSLVSTGCWTELTLKRILYPVLICPRVPNPDHYATPRTMSPVPRLAVSNWLSFQTQQTQIKLLILLNCSFAPEFFIKNTFFAKLPGLEISELLRHLNLIIDLLIKLHSLIKSNLSVPQKCYLLFLSPCLIATYFPYVEAKGSVCTSINLILSHPLYSPYFHVLIGNPQLA